MKKIIFIAVIVIIVGFAIYQGVFKEKTPEYKLVKVSRGDVIQKISETGQVQKGEEINLGFNNAGTIEKIYVKVGDKVESGQALVKLDTTELAIELDEDRANLEIAQAKLDKLLSGSAPEEIQVAETTLNNARQNLQDTLGGSYEKGSGALTTVNSIQKTYFIGNDQDSITVKDKKSNIESSLLEAKKYIDAAQASPTNENIDSAFSKLRSALENIYADLTVIRNMTEAINYKDVVSSTDKTSLDTAKTNVNTGLTNLNTAQGAVTKAEDDLALKKAGPQQADVDLYEAQVKQAQAQVKIVENQIWQSTLRSPTKGKITKVTKRVGETAQTALAESVITILPNIPFEIKTNIYEEDVVKIEVANPVDISLVAFPNQVFKGRVVSINPAEELIDEVVYYETTINFDEAPEGIKPGMTADIVIKPAFKENVLLIPSGAIQKKDGKTIVRVLKDNVTQEREVTLGLEGSDGLSEVISGLIEGEDIIVNP